MTERRILVAGVGNIFFGDDAFGVEVAQRLLRRPPMEGVTIRDLGIRGLDLTYALLEEYDAAIIVDAAPRGHAPGTLFVIEPDMSALASLSEQPQAMDLLVETHGMDPAKVLRLVTAMGGSVRQVLVLGCEPSPVNAEEDFQMGLSPPVEAAIDKAVSLVESLVARLQSHSSDISGAVVGPAPNVVQGDLPCPP